MAISLVPVNAAAQKKTTAADTKSEKTYGMTAAEMYQETGAQVARIRKIVEAHGKLLLTAQETDFLVAVDAITKDMDANRELLALATDLLADLKTALALEREGAGAQIISAPLDYPQFREVRILSDQAEQLYRSGSDFLEQLQKPTGTTVKRLESAEEEDEE